LKAGDEAVLSHNKMPALPKTPVTPRGPIIPTIGGLLGGDFPISKIPGLPNIPNINLPNIDFSNIPQGIKIPGVPNIPNISRVSEPVVQDMMFRDPENEFVSTKPPLTLGAPVNQAIDVQPITQPVTQPVVQDTIAESLANIPVSGTAPTNQVDPVLKGITPTEVLSDPFVRELYFGSPDTPGLIAQATEAAQKSFLDQPAILQQTAGLSPFEQEARGLAAAGIGSYEPFLREASGAYRGGLGSLYGSIGFGGPSARDYLGMSLEQYDPRMMGAFYDPFEQQVVQQTISDALQAAAQQDIQQRAADISRGGESAFGSRARLGAEERQRSLGRGLGETLGKIRSGGFQNAQDRALQELERRRSGARSAAQLESGFGGQLSQAQRLYGSDISGLGRMGQQLRGADISQLAGLGSTARGIEEQRLAREYAQQQATRMAPLQATQFVKGFAPQYVPGKTQIEKQYGMPVDPLTYGLSTAFGTYAQFVPQQQQQQTQQAGIAGLPQGQFTFTGGYPQQTPTYGGYQPTPYSTPGGYI
jgi:hypothetical protein